jgi:hypothetical protein
MLYALLTPESLERVYSDVDVFADVPPDSPFIDTLADAGVIHGCGNGLFQPERCLTRGEMLTLFSRFVEPRTDQSIQLEHWSADAVITAASLGWLEYSDDFNPDAEVTVREFADFALIVFAWANE